MNFNGLSKDMRIKSTLHFFATKYGLDKFRIRDHWEGDLMAIGLCDIDEKHLIYFSVTGENEFFVSLENLVTVGDLPYEPAGDYERVDLKELDRIFVEHLRINKNNLL